MILIVGSGRDPHVMAVLRNLSDRNVNAVLLDAYDPETSGLEYNLAQSVELALGRDGVRLSDVTSVWWRQKAKPEIPSDSVLALYDYGFVQREWNTIFDFLAAKTEHVFEINNRQRAKLAENKAFQLEVAQDFSLNTPRTIITNRCEHALRFFSQKGVARCVYKSFSPYMPPNGTMAYTTELDIAEMAGKDFRETADTTPGIFQELIEPDYELRVTVVGDRIFTARIDPPDDQGIDWRVSLFRNKYSSAYLPKNLEEQLLQYQSKLGLVFAAYDFIVSRSQEIFFLEVNPSGQWMWLEQQLGFGISEAVAERLMNSGK